jgi:hypothetical protein
MSDPKRQFNHGWTRMNTDSEGFSQAEPSNGQVNRLSDSYPCSSCQSVVASPSTAGFRMMVLAITFRGLRKLAPG